jgi:hypothetical protein
MQLAQVKSGYREHGKRSDPQRPSRSGLSACCRRERHHERDERVRQQSHRVDGGNTVARQRGGEMENRRQRADRVRNEGNRAVPQTADCLVATAKHRVHDDGGQQTKRAESDGRDQWKRSRNSEFRQDVAGQRAQVPEQSKN